MGTAEPSKGGQGDQPCPCTDGRSHAVALHKRKRLRPPPPAMPRPNLGEVAQLESGGECDGFRSPAAISPGCLVMVVKPHRAWIPMLCFHLPTLCIANGGPQGSHLNPSRNRASVPAQVPRMRAPPKFSIKEVHAVPQCSLLVSRW